MSMVRDVSSVDGSSSARIEFNVIEAFGPWFVGVCFDWLFMGMLMSQVYNYYAYFRRDPRWIKILVGVVFVAACFKTGYDFLMIWEKTVQHFGDYTFAASFRWYTYLEPSISQLLSSLAQSFFIFRCFRLTNGSYPVLLGLSSAMVVALALSFCWSRKPDIDLGDIVAVQNFINGIRPFAVASLTITVAVDVLITSTVTYVLYKSKTGVNSETDTMLTRLVKLTWESALPPALSAVLNLIAFLASPTSTANLFFNMLTPRLYAFSLMHTLNARPFIRSGPNTEYDPASEGCATNSKHHPRGSASHNVTRKDGRKSRHLDIIPVHVLTEIVSQTAPTDGYDRRDMIVTSLSAAGQQRSELHPQKENVPDRWSLNTEDVKFKRDDADGDNQPVYPMYTLSEKGDSV